MSDIAVTAVSRQKGLLDEINILANNIANVSTAGYKREASVFTEYVKAAPGEPSLSIGALRGRYAVFDEGPMVKTGGRMTSPSPAKDFLLSKPTPGYFLPAAGSSAGMLKGGW